MNQKSKGSGLIFAVVLLFVILGMVITLSSITVLETKMSQKTKSSVGAFYNADSGVEWALNKIANGSGPNIRNVFNFFNSDGSTYPSSDAGYKVYLLDKDGNVITTNLTIDQVKAVRSVGTQFAGGAADTQRAIEAAVASGGGISYTQYCCFNASACAPVCPTSVTIGTTQGPCDSGFVIAKDLGVWKQVQWGRGSCSNPETTVMPYGIAPTSSYTECGQWDIGEAYLCSK